MSALSNPPPTKDTSLPASPTSTVSPFASPNAIPPRSSSHGLVNPNTAAQRSRVSVLRPLSEIDWMSQSSSLSAKSKRNSNSAVPLVQQLQQQQQSPPTSPTTFTNMVSQQSQANSQPTPMSYTPQPSQSQSQVQPSHASPPPPPPAQDNFHDKLIYGSQTTWTEEKERILLGPYDYLVGHPGKDVRSQFIAAFNKWLRVPEDRLEVITRVVGMLHTASLLVDDVEDSSVLRRGIPVANSIFGTAQTINSANYVYFKALADVVSLGNPKLIDIFTEELINLHRGQGMELYWRDSLTCPSEEDYLEMVGNKTGGLFRLAIKLMQSESSVDIDCTPLVSTVGILFQILDDHLNLSPTSGYSSLKGLCEDLTEGKFSFPVIHAIRADPGNHVLMNILKQKTNDEEVKRYAIRYMEERGSFEYSKGVIQRLRERSEQLVAEVEGRLGGLGVEATEGGAALRKVLERLVLR